MHIHALLLDAPAVEAPTTTAPTPAPAAAAATPETDELRVPTIQSTTY